MPRHSPLDPGPTRCFTAVDSRGRVGSSYKEMGGWHLLVLVAEATPSGYLAMLREESIPTWWPAPTGSTWASPSTGSTTSSASPPW